MDNFPLFFRGKNSSVCVAASVDGERPTVGDLKEKLVAFAALTPIHVGFNLDGRTEKRINLTADSILVFREGTDPLGDNELLSRRGGSVYCVFETFDSVPANLLLLRRVRAGNQVHPAVTSDQPTLFSAVSPLLNAAQSTGEMGPSFYRKGNKTFVRGISMGCDYATKVIDDGETDQMDLPNHPASDVTPEENGWTSMTLEQLLSLNPNHPVDLDQDPFGVLHTPTLFREAPLAHPVFAKGVVKTVVLLNKKKKNLRRELYYRFLFAPNTSLADMGMTLIYDNGSNGHFTLIPIGEASRIFQPTWGTDDYRFAPHIFHRYRDLSPATAHPETCTFQIAGDDYLAFPLVAKAFQLHDFAMLANGLSEGDEKTQLDDETVELYNAATVVSGNTDRVTNGADVSDALLSLEQASFRVQDVPYFHLGVLFHAMEEIFLEKPVHHSSDDDDSSDGRGEKEEECIDSAKDIILARMEAFESESTTMPPTNPPVEHRVLPGSPAPSLMTKPRQVSPDTAPN